MIVENLALQGPWEAARVARGWFPALPGFLALTTPSVFEVHMAELDPLTFLIATELFASPDRNTRSQPPTLVHRNVNVQSTLILLSPGSKDPGWTEPFESLCLRAQRDFGSNAVRVAYLRFISPSLPEVVEDLLSHRIHQFRVLPLFLSAGGNMSEDISELLEGLCRKYAALEIELLNPISEDPRFQRLMWQLVREQVLPSWLAKTS